METMFKLSDEFSPILQQEIVSDVEKEPAVLREEIDWDTLLGFFPKQKIALDKMYSSRFILYGGARGGGKSRFLRWAAVDFLVTMFEEKGIRNVRVGLFCETYPDLRDRQISKIRAEFPSWMGKLADTKGEGWAFILNDDLGGGIIALRNLDDASKYQSAEFAAIFVDELTKITKETFDYLRGSLRWPGIAHTVFVGATNPGSIGHAWVKALWIDGVFPKEMEPLAPEFSFIQSLPSDNPKLDQTYWNDLNTLPDDLRRAWVLGQWDVFDGQVFNAWGPQHIIDPMEIPDYWARMVGLDWGKNAPFCALWGAQNPTSKQIVIYRELYQADLADEEQAMAVKQHSQDEFIRHYFADPSMFTRRKLRENVNLSTADIYLEHHMVLTEADNDRLSGKRKVERMLLTTPYGEPGLVVFKTCKNLIRTLPSLPYRKTGNLEDVDTRAEDHAYDALRYLLSAAKGVIRDPNENQGRESQPQHPLLAAIRRRHSQWRS